MREDGLAALHHEEPPKQVPMYDIRIDDYIIQSIMNTTAVDVETEIACLKKLGFAMITAHPLNLEKTEFKDPQTGRKGYIDEWSREYRIIDGMKFYAAGRLQEEDLDAKEWDPTIEARYRNVEEVIEKAEDLAIIGRVGGTFERALLAVGPEKFFSNLYDRPNFIHTLLEEPSKYNGVT